MKIIVTEETVNILQQQAGLGDPEAIERIGYYNTLKGEKKEGYFVFTDELNNEGNGTTN